MRTGGTLSHHPRKGRAIKRKAMEGVTFFLQTRMNKAGRSD
jgi:hypothetical protein